MSTNYYVRTYICPRCNRYDSFHIGKTAAGWTFSFHGERNEGTDRTPLGIIITSFEDWKPILKHSKIFDEYGVGIPYDEFVNMVESFKSDKQNKTHIKEFPEVYNWLDDDGHSFSEGEWS